LVPAKRWWRSTAVKITVGLASHHRITDVVVYPPTGSMA